MIYLYMGLISILFAMIYSFFKERNIVTPFFFLSFSILLILGAIRYNVGTDYILYSNYQIPFVLDNKDVNFEFLAKEVTKFGFLLSGQEHYQYIFAIYHFICVFFVFYAIKKQSKILSLSIFIYIFSGFYNFSLNGMRQAMAISIILYSMRFIFERKMLYVLVVIITSLFHKSAFICLLLVFFDRKTLGMKSFLIILFLIFSIFILFRGFIYSIISTLGMYSEYIGGQFDTGEYNITVTIYGIVTFAIFHSLNELTKECFLRERVFYININYVLFMLTLIMSFIPNGYRLFYIFLPFHIIIFPNMIFLLKNRNNRYVYGVCLLLFYFLFFTKAILITNYGETLPYRVYPDLEHFFSGY
ncbi:EpsG family protein [Rodentibacter pneumotropicus]|uniref:EpsG family protein n=1 Tax=Rodentibacter pneumotropicus TaxID=758 RepID=UPI00242B124D|nr:EpsG family protein [Rodentibacter pneumotropicus]